VFINFNLRDEHKQQTLQKGRDRKEQDKRESYLYKQEYVVCTVFIHIMNECSYRIKDDDDDGGVGMMGER
jgi:hypothetical protein